MVERVVWPGNKGLSVGIVPSKFILWTLPHMVFSFCPFWWGLDAPPRLPPPPSPTPQYNLPSGPKEIRLPKCPFHVDADSVVCKTCQLLAAVPFKVNLASDKNPPVML